MTPLCARETQTARELVQVTLERQDHVEYLLTVTRLLHIHDLAAAAIGDARLPCGTLSDCAFGNSCGIFIPRPEG